MQDISPQSLSKDFTRVQIADIDRSDKFKILWGWFWRILIITLFVIIAAMIAGGIVGFIIGVILALAKVDIEGYRIIFQILGGLVGLGVSFFGYYFLIKWVTLSRIGGYEFWLVKRNNP